ncbi:MAG: lipid II flippase MurJ, partial [Burkholderiaceae bacterium]
GFYARQDTRTPAKIAISVLLLTQLFNLALVPLIGVAGLALSIGLAALVNAGWLGFTLRVLLACAAMGVLQYLLSMQLDWVGAGRHELKRALWMAASLAGSAAVYFLVLTLSGLKLREIARRT